MSNRILLIEDQPRDISWLTDLLRKRGYAVTEITNGQAGLEALDQVQEALKSGPSPYKLAIFDIKVAAQDFRDLSKLDLSFVERSERMGLELSQYARETLGIRPRDLPILILSSVSDHPEVVEELDRLKIPRFNKASQDDNDSIRAYLKKNLPAVSARDA